MRSRVARHEAGAVWLLAAALAGCVTPTRSTLAAYSEGSGLAERETAQALAECQARRGDGAAIRRERVRRGRSIAPAQGGSRAASSTTAPTGAAAGARAARRPNAGHRP